MVAHAAAARLMADECLCFRARRASRALTRRYDEALRPLGIQATQLTLLNAIALGGEAGQPLGGLADFLAMDPTTLSRNVRPLEKAGWVRVDRTPADGRSRVARLTPPGQRMIETALPAWQRAHRQILAALGLKRAAGLRESIDATVAAISDDRPALSHSRS